MRICCHCVVLQAHLNIWFVFPLQHLSNHANCDVKEAWQSWDGMGFFSLNTSFPSVKESPTLEDRRGFSGSESTSPQKKRVIPKKGGVALNVASAHNPPKKEQWR